MGNKNYLKIISLFGLIGAVFYFFHVFLGTVFYEGYNSFSQAVSDLTASNSPSRNIAFPLSVFYGIFTVIFSSSFFVYFKGKINTCVTLGSCAFCIMTIISFFGYTFFPLTEAGYAGTFQDKMHMVVTILIVVFTIISLILYCIGFLKTETYKYIGIISLCTLIFLMSGAMVINILPKKYFGLAERINVYSIIIFTGILSLWMNKYVENNGVRTNGV